MHSGNPQTRRRLLEFAIGVPIGSLSALGCLLCYTTGYGGALGALTCAALGAAAIVVAMVALVRLLRLTTDSVDGAHRPPMTGGGIPVATVMPPHRDHPSDPLTHWAQTLPISPSVETSGAVFANHSDAVLVTDRSGFITYSNPSATDLLGWSASELRSRPLPALIDSAHQPDLCIQDLINRSQEIGLRVKDGNTVLVLLTGSSFAKSDAGAPGAAPSPTTDEYCVFVARDVIEKHHREHRVSYVARYDSLTNLPNRIRFQHLLQQAIERADRSDQSLAVLYFDLDRFKDINDSFGHPAGDRALQILSERLLQILPAGTALGRLAGDEFGAFIEGVSQQDDPMVLELLSREVINDVSRAFFMADTEIYLTTSIGIAQYPADGTNAVELVRNADAAMYHAKQSGGGGYAFYTTGMNAEAVERLILKSRLRRGLQNNEFSLLYQPKIDLRTGSVVSAEALLRWRVPGRGDIPPAQFIPLAETTGLIMPIGTWVLRRVCEDYRRWRLDGRAPARVSANVSLREIEQPGFVEQCAAIFDEFGVSGKCIELEITETTLMANTQRTIDTLDKLHALGVSISIDDFGTGYSSLSTLQRLPVEQLKIDQSFVSNITQTPHNALLVKTMIEMARNLQLEVVAEGVQNQIQAEFLRIQGCHYAQGDWAGAPMTAAEFAQNLLSPIRQFETPNPAQPVGAAVHPD